MGISYERFRLALSNLDPTQWRIFERLANVFMASEYPSLRPIAAASGDGGADALLFYPEDDPSVVIQFSVTVDWNSKIIQTAKRIRETYPQGKILIYVTNQEIAAKASALRAQVRKDHGFFLDVRDREWLLTNRNASTANEVEAESLAQAVVDPLMQSSELLSRQAQALDDLEAKAAFVYLGLQWADDEREKGLTKLCFEALVRSVLRETTSEKRMTRTEVRQLVHRLLPAHRNATLDTQVDGALQRLSKRYIRHWQKLDEFCLTWDERVRLQDRVADMALLDQALTDEVRKALLVTSSEAGEPLGETSLTQLAQMARQILERVLLDRGEAFASAVAKENAELVRAEDVDAVVTKVITDLRKSPPAGAQLLPAAVKSLLLQPPTEVRNYLRSLADTYTLFAFMRETPDVQSAVVKMFSDGDIWLDTNVILPLMAEELLDAGVRAHTDLIAAAKECGIRLYITEGVLEELTTHIARSKSYAHALTGEGARGEPPFLYMSHHLAGLALGDFDHWLDTFCGADPEADLLDYLEEVHGIELMDLRQYAESAPVELRAAVGEVWHEARDARDRRAASLGLPAMDINTRAKLVDHDVENYLGVVFRREQRGERRSTFGYRSWWLTLDRNAFRINDAIKDSLPTHIKVPASPAISPDFMLNYLAIGPVRGRLSKRSEETLPLMLNMSVLDAVPRDITELAETLRRELDGLPHRIVKRKIKETLEDARRLLGPKAEAGEVGLTEEVKKRLIAAARDR